MIRPAPIAELRTREGKPTRSERPGFARTVVLEDALLNVHGQARVFVFPRRVRAKPSSPVSLQGAIPCKVLFAPRKRRVGVTHGLRPRRTAPSAGLRCAGCSDQSSIPRTASRLPSVPSATGHSICEHEGRSTLPRVTSRTSRAPRPSMSAGRRSRDGTVLHAPVGQVAARSSGAPRQEQRHDDSSQQSGASERQPVQ